ncbi:tyrosine-type recombinase/integrase [Geofilum rhodophaeum]|uniref:tyrosine-type recombinase/integrase n=1 Tax=Geofilum rhodophaeum TaxID=1965019 RepID=UPI000B523ACE|nr:tyrosine-type recombinase/integrase [Geofilum rhodophaeum]
MRKKPEYIFNKEIESKLTSFKIYLQKLGNGANTIRQKSNYAGYFLKWLETEHLQPEETRYNDLLSFIDYCKLEVDALSGVEGNSKRHINSKLRSIRNFYEYLKQSNPTIINPATNLNLKGIRQKLPSNIIDFNELENLYQSLETTTNREKRNKIILGILVYQGVTTEELHRLEPSHLKLKEGKIVVPGNRRRNSRKLELKPVQILELHEYLTEIRPTILKEITAPRPARKPTKINHPKIENQLFISIDGSENIKNSLLYMFKAIQKLNPEILHPKQIRASVITYWLKNNNLRQVQYMAGHKYVSSTERYQLNNLDSLQKALEKCHPLKYKTT